MNEQQALSLMVSPGTRRPGKYREGVIQIWVTRACDKACFGCTQGSNLAGKPRFITPEQFEVALQSLAGYWGVVGMFGGNPAIHPDFIGLCELMQKYVPWEQRGLWCNNPLTPEKAQMMRQTFNPSVSNINVHLDHGAASMFRQYWPEVRIVGLAEDSRHSPPYVALKDVIQDEDERWNRISHCDINRHWSAMIGVFRGGVRAWFCEVAGAQAMLHQDEPDYPDTGINLEAHKGFMGIKVDDASNLAGSLQWWELPMSEFSHQVRKHCHECGIPLRAYGELAQADNRFGTEYTSETHAGVYKPKRPGRRVELLTVQPAQVLPKVTDYLGNARRLCS